MKDVTVLVVGGAGYIGAHMVKALLEEGGNVIVLDDLSRGHRDLGNSKGYSVREVIALARNITGHPIPTEETARRAGDPAVLVAGSEKIKRELGWHPRYENLETIIETAWRWHRREAERVLP